MDSADMHKENNYSRYNNLFILIPYNYSVNTIGRKFLNVTLFNNIQSIYILYV